MFKKAYVRGVLSGLIQSGQAAFPSEEKAAACADYVAERIDIPLFDEKSAAVQVPLAVTAKIAGVLIDASNSFKQAGEKLVEPAKLASIEDLAKVAHANVVHLMKIAEGSTIEGGDKGNKPEGAAAAETKMDNAARPSGYAEDSRGKTEVDTRPGAVGKEQEHPKAPSESPSGDNSVKEQSRTASLGALIQKMAEGSTLLGGDKGNKPDQATAAEAKMDHAQRPWPSYAHLPSQGAAGEIPGMVRGPAVVGRETPHPNAPSNSPSGSNSVIEHSQKAAEDAAFLTVFKKTASEVLPHMAGLELNEDEKIAHVKTMMGYTDEQRARHIISLQRAKTAAAATVGQPAGNGLPSGHPYGTEHNPEVSAKTKTYDGRAGNQKQSSLAEVIEAAKKDDDKGGEKKDEKKDEKKEEEKKEASLLDRIQSIGAAAPAA